MSIKVEVWGDYACFSRPELKSERVSYDMITPAAARGILESIYWHPGLRWIIDEIFILPPMNAAGKTSGDYFEFQMTSIKRNELTSKISARNVQKVMNDKTGELALYSSNDRTQRSSLILKDVHYVIEAHFELTQNASPGDNEGKFQDIMRRRLRRGQCYHHPYLGCREFPANFREWEGKKVDTIPMTKDLGYMLYDMEYSDPSNIRPMFFRAKVINGKLNLRECEVVM